MLHFKNIICIFALWIGWSSYQPIRGKSITPSTSNLIDVTKKIDNMAKGLTRKNFIERSTLIHEGKYDYTNVVYKNVRTPVEIICPIHGSFSQTPQNHLIGCGCKRCSYVKRGVGIPHRKRRALVCGVGINDIDCSCGYIFDDNLSRIYKIWKTMLRRCYIHTNKKHVSYNGCSVCEEWLRFSNFKDWFDKHYVEGYALDKDILVKGNKIYSPQTCRFVPQYINSLLVKDKSRRGKYLIGVTKKDKKYRAVIRKNGKYVCLGRFDTEIDAFLAYKREKEEYIRMVADEYHEKNLIDDDIYNALINYSVEQDD